VHVLGPADHPEFGHGLVGRDDQLHPRPPVRTRRSPVVGFGAERRINRLRQLEDLLDRRRRLLGMVLNASALMAHGFFEIRPSSTAVPRMARSRR
jgi:hypothetical protein